MGSDRRQVGQSSLLVIAVLVVVVLGIAVLAATAGLAHDRSRARTAADAGALAAVLDGDAAARQVARRNGATEVTIAWSGDEVEVQVRVGRAEATARATALRRIHRGSDHRRTLGPWQSLRR